MNKFVDMHELLNVLDGSEILWRCSVKQDTR